MEDYNKYKKETLVKMAESMDRGYKSLSDENSHFKSQNKKLKDNIKIIEKRLFDLEKRYTAVIFLTQDIKRLREEKRKLAKELGYKLGVFRKKAHKKTQAH